MNKYVIGFLSLFDGELKLEQVEANSKYEAMASYLGFTSEDCASFNSEYAIHEYCSNSDSFISIMELTNVSRSGWSGNGLQTHAAEFDSLATFH